MWCISVNIFLNIQMNSTHVLIHLTKMQMEEYVQIEFQIQ